jgi:chromosome segregation ATPase
MNTPMTVIPGKFFDGGVSDPGEAQPAKPQKRAFTDQYQALLSTMFWNLAEDSEAKGACERLLVQRAKLNESCYAFIEEQMKKLGEALIVQHEEAKELVRQQFEKIAKLDARRAEMQQELHQRKGTKAQAQTEHNEATQKRKQVSRYAPRPKIAAADAAIEKAWERVKKADGRVAEILQMIQDIDFRQREPLLKELNELQAKEVELDARITGKPFTNDLGLVVTPSPWPL